jgi:hypothetical protein
MGRILTERDAAAADVVRRRTMLRSLHMKDVGPAAQFDLELGERLNVLTGDNGLGKSFVLDVAWWALTGTWVGKPVLPRKGKEDEAELSGERDVSDLRYAKFFANFSRLRQDWTNHAHHALSGTIQLNDVTTSMPAWLRDRAPVIYVRIGGFSVWDPVRFVSAETPHPDYNVVLPEAFHFDEHKLWMGGERDDKVPFDGLIRDWDHWWLLSQAGRESPFGLLAKVLDSLSHPTEKMTATEPRRVYLNDPRDYPTVDLGYDNVPIIHLSAGMRRVVGLAYLIVWTWTEHVKACRLLGFDPAKKIVVLVDEMEAHLHPKWQRHILPQLIDVLAGLGTGTEPQVVMTTHSPMVMASLEPCFDEERDKLFLFELHQKDVSLREVPWAKHGDAVAWLTSPIFGLEQARSREAERAIEAAYDFMAGRTAELPEGLRTADQIDHELHRVLPDQDKFWPRWVVWRERKSA